MRVLTRLRTALTFDDLTSEPGELRPQSEPSDWYECRNLLSMTNVVEKSPARPSVIVMQFMADDCTLDCRLTVFAANFACTKLGSLPDELSFMVLMDSKVKLRYLPRVLIVGMS